MNFRISVLAAALGACTLFASSCVGPDMAYAGGGGGGYGPSRSYSNYTVSLGDGYAGRGYYYGPPNTRYYNRTAGVTYYRTRESVPQHYWGGSSAVRTSVSSSYRPGTSRPSSSYPGYRGPSSRDSRWDNDRDRDGRGDRDGDRDRDDNDRDRDYRRGSR
eukprot:gene9907-12156_t